MVTAPLNWHNPASNQDEVINIMIIERDKVIAFNYILRDEAGVELERSEKAKPTVYLHGHGNIMQGLEDELKGKSEGDELSVTLPPEKAYGFRKQDAEQRIPIKHLLTKHKKYKTGMAVKVNTDNGPKDVVIIKVGRFNVDVDNNHPLAGKTIIFDINIEKIRNATGDEISHGHTHGIDGHDHH